MKKILIILVLVLIIILIIVIPKYLGEFSSAQKRISTYVVNRVNTPVAPIEYYRTGKGSPILISHGITGGFDQGLGLANLYIGSGYDLTAVSRFGYVGSPLPEDSSPDAQAETYRYLLDELNIDKTFVFGNSAGGTSAIKFAMRYPDRCLGLILVSSNVPTNEAAMMPPKPLMKVVFGSDFIYWSFVKLMHDNMLSVVGVPKPMTGILSRQKKDELINDIVMGGFPISLRTNGIINDMYVSNPDINNNYAFEQIKVPVLMIVAKDDPLSSYEGALTISKKIPNIEFISFEKGGHIILDHEAEIQRKIKAFISSKD